MAENMNMAENTRRGKRGRNHRLNRFEWTPGMVAMLILLILFAFIQLFPLIWMANFSLAASTEMFTGDILIKPATIRWSNYVYVFVDGHFLQYFKNSLVINTLAVLLVLIVSIMASFACTRMRWKLSGVVRNVLLLGMMIPIHATLLPNFFIYDKLRITDSIWALLIPYVAFSLPQGVFLTSGFMASVPREIEEAAIIDGCGIYRMLLTVITPMLKASLVTVAIMTYLNNWNEFMMASTYLRSPAWKTLPFSILEFQGQYSANYAVQFAVMTLTALPAVLIYILLNRHITKGVALGAVKA